MSICADVPDVHLQIAENCGYDETAAAKPTEHSGRAVSTGSSSIRTKSSIMYPEFDANVAWSDLKIGELIGVGSFGKVYEAYWHGIRIAVKKLPGNELFIGFIQSI